MKEKRKYNIHGTVSGKRDGSGITNLKIEAWDKDPVHDDLLGSAVTVFQTSIERINKQSRNA